MNLEKLQQNWNRLGAKDPWWAILSHPDKRDNSWDIEEFFATGRELIDETLQWVTDSGIDLDKGHALDFGCGAGRLTQALAHHFEHVTGVDIAPSMIQHARSLERRLAKPDAVKFVLNPRADLTVFDDAVFDFVCSYIVLQHMEPRYAEGYLREFARVLKPGGCVVFQMPSEPVPTLKGRVRRVLATPTLQPILNLYKRLRYRQPCAMEMYGISTSRIGELFAEIGLRVVERSECTSAGPTWTSHRYMVVRVGTPETETKTPTDSLRPTVGAPSA